MNPYTYTIQALNLNKESQNDNAWLYALLLVQASAYDADPPGFTGRAIDYVWDQLSSINAPFAVDRAKQILNTLKHK
jgi:hypothetical protein